jgi:hypothetical protein
METWSDSFPLAEPPRVRVVLLKRFALAGQAPTPCCIPSRGGVTARDIAAKALGVQRAIVMGQIIPGVPVWRLGEGSRFPGMNYIVFPGNVGGETAMTDVVQALKSG